MRIRAKLLALLSALTVSIFCISIPSVYADVDLKIKAEDLERLANAESKAESAGLKAATTIWMTENIDLEKTMPFLVDYMLWENEYPYTDNPDNNDVEFDYEIKEDQYGTILCTYFKAGLNQDKYGRFSRIKKLESVDNAEYIIASTDYDCYTIVVDGNTYKDKNLGPLLNAAIKENSTALKEYPNFDIDYSEACEVFTTNVFVSLYQTIDSTDHMVLAQAKVGFNLTVDSYVPVINDPVDDDYIYGGDEDNKLDDTPSTAESSNTKFDLGKAIGITISVLSGIVLIYVFYALITKIYKLIKETK